MKMLYLVYRSFSPRLKSEILLVVQIWAVITLLNASIIPFVEYGQLKQIIADEIPENMVYYSVPTFARTSHEEYDYISQFFSDEQVNSICLTYHTVGYVNGCKADIYLYNREMLECIKGGVIDGDWRCEEKSIFINQGIKDSLGLCKEYELQVKNEFFQIAGSYLFAGMINKRDIVYDISYAGSEPEYGQLGIDYSNVRYLNPTHTDLLAIVPFDFSNMDSYAAFDGALLCLNSGIDKEAFINAYNNSEKNGQMISLKGMEENSVKRLIGAYKFDALISILLAVSTIFGIGGYTYVKLDGLKKQIGIYYLCGCPKHLFSVVVIISNCLILAISVMLAFYSRNLIVLSEGNDSFWSFIISSVFTSIALFVPLLAVIRTAKKLSFSQLVYGDD